jgi:hypothetical protein
VEGRILRFRSMLCFSTPFRCVGTLGSGLQVFNSVTAISESACFTLSIQEWQKPQNSDSAKACLGSPG